MSRRRETTRRGPETTKLAPAGGFGSRRPPAAATITSGFNVRRGSRDLGRSPRSVSLFFQGGRPRCFTRNASAMRRHRRYLVLRLVFFAVQRAPKNRHGPERKGGDSRLRFWCSCRRNNLTGRTRSSGRRLRLILRLRIVISCLD